MDSFQKSFSICLCLGVVLLLGVTVTTEGSVRTLPVADIRDAFVWGPDRYIRREIEEGILLPPYPEETRVEGARSQSLNLVQPNPNSVIHIVFPKPVADTAEIAKDKSFSQEGDTIDGNSQMPYVDSSQFRKSNSRAEEIEPQNIPFPKKVTGKYFGLDGVKATAGEKVSKAVDKHTEFGLQKKKHNYENKVNVPSTTDVKTLQPTTTESDAIGKETEESNGPVRVPPVWSHSSLAEELSDPFGRLPSNEEYDRDSRFAHSILYGYNTGF